MKEKCNWKGCNCYGPPMEMLIVQLKRWDQIFMGFSDEANLPKFARSTFKSSKNKDAQAQQSTEQFKSWYSTNPTDSVPCGLAWCFACNRPLSQYRLGTWLKYAVWETIWRTWIKNSDAIPIYETMVSISIHEHKHIGLVSDVSSNNKWITRRCFSLKLLACNH